jgi:hypothetical protein
MVVLIGGGEEGLQASAFGHCILDRVEVRL